MKTKKHFFASVFLTLVFLIVNGSSAYATGITTEPEIGTTLPLNENIVYEEGEVIVLTNYSVDLSLYSGNGPFDFNGVDIVSIEPLFDNCTASKQGVWENNSGGVYPYKVELLPSAVVEDAVEILNCSNKIASAEPNYICESSELTDDYATRTATQWAHDYLSMNEVWNSGFVGTNAVKVAVIDSGFVEHEDLENNMNMDLAYDSFNDNNDVSTIVSHGNMCVGIIGADCDDVGANGICQSVNIIPIQTYTSFPGDEHYESLIAGVAYAIQNGAKIINVSQKIPYADVTVLRNLISSANVLFITAAGNAGDDIEDALADVGKVHDDPNWIVVGAISSDGTKYSDSNFSSRYVDLFAPGDMIYSTAANGYGTDSGTSFASPHVAATCALIMSHATHLTPLQVKERIMAGVNIVEGFDEFCVSGGTLSITNVIDTLYSENRGAYTKGDLNGDGFVNMFDYALCKQIYLESITPTAIQRNAADINGDNTVNVFDSALLKKYCNQTYYFPPV